MIMDYGYKNIQPFALMYSIDFTVVNQYNNNDIVIIGYIRYKVWNEITYSFANFNGAAVEVWE